MKIIIRRKLTKKRRDNNKYWDIPRITLRPMVPLEPELEDGIDEGVGVPVFLYYIFLDQRLLVSADGLRGPK